MKLTRAQQDTKANRSTGWHILTVAEAGFSMLDFYGRLQHGLDIEVIRQLADRCNEQDEAGAYILTPRLALYQGVFSVS